ncbi:hypothetical protein KUTeg_004136 [Tegillarca granosa]|uniref:Uncharacterized protein n=1 Tax=Tegillarca granosa TaxID=220873 RepID=A0ABQ9FRY7_TEGGR|nr:hypothetical protein KUTeg_004136 [Tegillarca granosa]
MRCSDIVKKTILYEEILDIYEDVLDTLVGGPGVKKAVGVKRHQENDELGPVPKRLSTKQSENIKKTPTK